MKKKFSISKKISNYRFTVKAFPNNGTRPRELVHTMKAHPLSYMELDYDPEYSLYNGRLTPEFLNNASDDAVLEGIAKKVNEFMQERPLFVMS